MISINLKKSRFNLSIDWFAEAPKLKNAFRLAVYRQCLDTKNHPLFIKTQFHTIHIDLTQDDKDIQSSFTKNTQYEIRRAERDGVYCRKDIDTDSFIDFFNSFAKSKNRPQIKISDIDIFKEKLLITGAFHSETPLVMHCYLLDPDGSRVRLLHSASEFRNLITSEQRNLVGRANRLLHYYDMRTAKDMSIKIYDLGGYSISDIDEEKQKINEFKKSFGGSIVEEPDYISYPTYILSALSNTMKSRSHAQISNKTQ